MTGEILLPKPHSAQTGIITDDTRFQVWACGRRFGKTKGAAIRAVLCAIRRGRCWWIGPTFPVASIGWREIKRMVNGVWADKSETERMLCLPTGGEIWVKSADNPDSLRGEGLDLAIFDECGFTKEAAWDEAIRPALADRRGEAIFISTPKGKNWFFRLFVDGQDSSKAGWSAHHHPTADNPYIPAEDIEEARLSTPDRIFRQEWLAEFMEDAGGVFRGVMAAASGELESPNGCRTAIGVDWAKHEDFTVLSVLADDPPRLVAWDRFNQIDYAFQLKRLEALCGKWKPEVIMAESNAMGEPLVEQLKRSGLPVKGFATTATTKPPLIEDLSLAIEKGELVYPMIPELVNELQAYEYDTMPSGRMRYGAPDGIHDDCVISLALAWHGLKRQNLRVSYAPGLYN